MVIKKRFEWVIWTKIYYMNDTQFHGVPVKNLCSCIPDIPTYILELFLQNIPGTEISIYVKLYLYIYQQSSIEN